MKLRRRVKMCRLEHYCGILQDASAKERCSSNIMEGKERSKATSERGTGKGSLLGGSDTGSLSDILPLWPWRKSVSMAAGLLLACLLALTQAWCVNAIHENLLWFSQLTVRVIRAYQLDKWFFFFSSFCVPLFTWCSMSPSIWRSTHFLLFRLFTSHQWIERHNILSASFSQSKVIRQTNKL